MPSVSAKNAPVQRRLSAVGLPLWLSRPLTWPFPVQLVSLGLAIALALPLAAKLYGKWWDLIFGGGSFCSNFLPLQ